MNPRLAKAFLIGFLIIGLTACGGSQPEPPKEDPAKAAKAAEPAKAAAETKATTEVKADDAKAKAAADAAAAAAAAKAKAEAEAAAAAKKKADAQAKVASEKQAKADELAARKKAEEQALARMSEPAPVGVQDPAAGKRITGDPLAGPLPKLDCTSNRTAREGCK